MLPSSCTPKRRMRLFFAMALALPSFAVMAERAAWFFRAWTSCSLFR